MGFSRKNEKFAPRLASLASEIVIIIQYFVFCNLFFNFFGPKMQIFKKKISLKNFSDLIDSDNYKKFLYYISINRNQINRLMDFY